MHHVFQNLQGRETSVIASTREKILTAEIGGSTEENEQGQLRTTRGVKYIDSLSFLNASLGTLATNLPKEQFTSVKEHLKDQIINYPYPQRPINEQQRIQERKVELQGIFEPGTPCSGVLKGDDMIDYRNWKIPFKRDLTVEETAEIERKFQLLTRKGVYPYDWMDNAEKLESTCLPPKEAFYNKLNDSHITDEDYEHAQNVWQYFNCQTFQDYHELYLVTDVLLLADIFESFRGQSIEYYKLDPANYISAPSLAWDAMLKMTGINLELLSEEKRDIHLMIEQGIRGGVSISMKRYAESDENHTLMYLDANNLYGWAMSQPMPYGDFKQFTNTQVQNTNIEHLLNRDNTDVGYILKVDLEYPHELHDHHADLPLAPQRLQVQEEMLSEHQKHVYENLFVGKKFKSTPKLIPNLYNKEGYVIHERNLKQCIDLGLKVTKVHEIIEFKQSMWLKEYIDFNTQKRTHAENDFEKDFFKLMNNSVFGKTMENVRNHKKFEICTDGVVLRRWVRNPKFYGVIQINDDTLIVEKKKGKVILNKPIYIGFSILDVSKTLMYDFHYNFAKPNLPNVQLCYMDTDSFIYHIPMSKDQVNQVLKNHENEFDFSNYPKDHPNYSAKNKKVIGKMKDELGGVQMKEFIGLRSKMYSCQIYDGKTIKKAKGIKKNIVKKEIIHENYLQCLKEQRVFSHK